jgi:uncharacterized repeat protein (TIGR01451 family)
MIRSVVLLLSLSLLGGDALAQCVSLTTLGSASTQNFNTLSNTAGSTTNNLTITGWFLNEVGGGTRDNEQYAVDTGGSNTGDTFSYGPAGNTERALGALQSGTLISTIGACYTNNTGATITSLAVAYTGEQWRIGNIALARDDRYDFQVSLNATDLATGTWTNHDTLDFTNPIKTAGAAAALDGNAAANRTAISATVGSLSIANGATFWIRWNDLNASGADDGLAIDDFSLTPQAVPPLPTLNISDVALAEGDPPGVETFTFAVTLTAPAGPGGVTFDIATADGTAQDDNPATEDNDYVPISLTGQTIPMGSTGPYNFSITINRDTTTEPNETFFVNVTSLVGGSAGDVQGQGTLNNDDVTLTPIHDIQGPGGSSPIVGASVSTRGIVTGVRNNGFFIQEPDAGVDADPATSEGVLVFTNAAPPAAAVVGALVQVTGTVAEFVPAQDPLQPPLTELVSPTVVQLTPINPLPTAVPLSAGFPDPAGPFDQLERVEGMRVSIASLTVGAPSGGTLSEPNANSTSNGVFQGVITGLPRAFREAGIQAPDPSPGGSIPPIPRFDSNPEVIRVDSDALGGAAIDAGTGTIVSNLAGPLDYTFRRYTLLPEAGPPPSVVGGPVPVPVTPATATEATIASYNLQRFYDTVEDPSVSDTVLTASAFDNRLTKASDGIRNFLGAPDILGVVEVENLVTLQALADRISSDAIAEAQPDPQYDAYLVEGNDIGGIDVGFLVKSAPVEGTTPRVEVVEVQQELDGTLFVNPDSSTSVLHDRPPLRLAAIVHAAGGATWPVTVIVNHLRALNDAGSIAPGANGWPTLGDRVRAKRLAQAQDVANLLQARQTADPTEAIVMVGDYNAFEVNDGFVDSISTLLGTPPPDNETAVPGDGVDLVNPNLSLLLASLPAAQRYSYVFDGNAQSIDHVLVNGSLLVGSLTERIEYARINADFPEILRGGVSASRLSDHDPVVLYVEPALFATTDLSITIADSPDPVNAGENLSYSITATNAGGIAAATAQWVATLPSGTTFVSLASPAGWTCTTPAVGAVGTIDCDNASFAPGAEMFTLVVTVDATVASGTVLSNTATISSATADTNSANDNGTATTTVATLADLGVSLLDTPDPVVAGTQLTYSIGVGNAGPSVANAVTLTNPLPAGTSFVSLATTGAWSCTTPAVGMGGTITCSVASLAPGSADTFTLVVALDGGLAGGSVLSSSVTIAGTTPDSNSANDNATETTTVDSVVDLALTIADSPDPVTAGTQLSYSIDVSNAGPSAASAVTLTDPLPIGTSFVSLTSPGGWSCTTPAVGANGTVVCDIGSLAPGAAAFTLVVATDAALATGSVLSNSATIGSATPDSNSGNDSATATTTVATSADLSVTVVDSADPVNAGTQLTYSIGLTNAGPSVATDTTLSDTLPIGTTFFSLTAPAGFNCTTPAVGAGGTISCSNPAFAPGTADFTLVVAIDVGLANGTVLSNTATATSTTSDPNPANGSATATTTIDAATIDLEVVLADSPDPVNAGAALTYTIVVNNSGPIAAADASLALPLPAATSFVSLTTPAGWTCTTPAVGSSGTLTCTNAAFAAGSAVFAAVANVDAATAAGTLLTATATVATTTGDSDPANGTATTQTTVATAADVSVTLADSADPVAAATQFSYTITANNAGPSVATAVAVNQTLPAGTTFVALVAPAGFTCTTPAVGANGSITCTVATMAAGNAAFTLTAAVDAGVASGTVLAGNATIATTTADPNPANNTASATTTVSAASGDMAITLSDLPDPVIAGNHVVYSSTITNNGPAAATGVSVTLPIPVGTSFVSASAGSGTGTCSATATTITCSYSGSIGTGLAGQRTLTFDLLVTPSVAAGTMLNATVSVASDAVESAPANNNATQATNVIASANLSTTLTATPAVVGTGTIATLTGTVTNAGPSDAQEVALAVTLPTGVSYVDATLAGGSCSTASVSGQTVVTCTWPGATAPNAARTVAIDVRVDAPTSSPITAMASAETDDPSATNNGAAIVLGQPGAVEAVTIPANDPLALLMLFGLLATLGGLALRRRG